LTDGIRNALRPARDADSGRSCGVPARRAAAALRRLTCALLLSLLSLAAGSCRAGEAETAPAGADAAARAGFLFNFLSYIDWPSSAFELAQDPYVVGVMNGETVLAELLLSATGRSVGGRPVEIRSLHEGDSLKGLHLLYVGPTPTERLSAILGAVVERWTVTVTDGDNGLAKGSAIHFFDTDGRLRFDVSLPAIARGGYRLSSRLLAIAQIRKDGE
jgi:hypothetical protein